MSDEALLPDRPVSETSDYSRLAGEFLGLMDEMAPQVRPDYSVESLQRLDQFISDCFEPIGERHIEESLVRGVGCYFGEVIIRQLDGYWNENGEPEVLLDLEELDPIRPLEKAQKRFQNGKPDSLAWAYHAIHKKVAEAENDIKPRHKGIVGDYHAAGQPDGSGILDYCRQLFGKVMGKG